MDKVCNPLKLKPGKIELKVFFFNFEQDNSAKWYTVKSHVELVYQHSTHSWWHSFRVLPRPGNDSKLLVLYNLNSLNSH